MDKAGRLSEFLIIFLILPMLDAEKLIPVPKMVVLLAVGLYCLVVLLILPDYATANLLAGSHPVRFLKSIGLRLILVTLGLLLLGWIFSPKTLFHFPVDHTAKWLLVIVVYPLISVIPQELIYRVFLFHRYRNFLKTPLSRIIVSTLCFGYLHIVYHNGIAVLLTLAGGALLSLTYERKGSFIYVALEHAIYGVVIFSTGLGTFFYNGHF